MKMDWPTHPLANYVTSRPGNNKIIKGSQSSQPRDGLVQAFSASGPDVWVASADYSRPGVVISAVGARCGKTFIATGEWTAIANTHVLLPGDQIDPRWLWYRTNDESFWIRGGTAQPFVKVKETLLQPCKIPPLPEQRRIVALLDEAFKALATAKANAEQNLQNARALFESHLESVFTEKGIDWVGTTIGKEINFIDYRGKTPVKTTRGVRLITAKNVKMGFLQDAPNEFIAADSYESWMTRGIPKKGDVLFTTEAPLANVAQLDTDDRVAFAQRIIIMQPNPARLDSAFLKYLLLSKPVQQRIRERGTGATVQGIKASLLKLIDISFPVSLAIQEEMVDKLDSLSHEVQRLASIYERKLAALEELKTSLLHQAFNGEL